MKVKLIIIALALIFALLASGCIGSENETQEILINQTYEIKLIESFREDGEITWRIHYVNSENEVPYIEEGDLPYTGKYTRETIQVIHVNDSRTYLVHEKDIINRGFQSLYLTHVYSLHLGDDIRVVGMDNSYRSARRTVETSIRQIYP